MPVTYSKKQKRLNLLQIAKVLEIGLRLDRPIVRGGAQLDRDTDMSLSELSIVLTRVMYRCLHGETWD